MLLEKMRGNRFKYHDLDKLEKWSEKTRLQFNKPENKHCIHMKKRTTQDRENANRLRFPRKGSRDVL